MSREDEEELSTLARLASSLWMAEDSEVGLAAEPETLAGLMQGGRPGRGVNALHPPPGAEGAALTQRAEGTHALAALLPGQVFLVAHRAHAVCSGVAIETTTGGTKHGHRALVRLLGHC